MLPKTLVVRPCPIMASALKPRHLSNQGLIAAFSARSAFLLFDRQRFVGLVLGGLERQIRLLRPEYGRLGPRVQEAGGLHFFVARQILERRQAEMLQEEVGGA